VVWPLVVFCTSSDVPLMAAMVPDVPGNRRAVPLAPPPPALPAAPPLPPLDDAAEGEVVEAEDEEPHAARATAATPSIEKDNARRARVA
jgi:hypothetical protein